VFSGNSAVPKGTIESWIARVGRYIGAMGPANPWSPNWRPDPTGRRLTAIRSSRRGAFWAGLLLWPLVLLATLTTPMPPMPEDQVVDLRQLILVAALSWPGLALLGAGLAPTAIGSRTDAVVAGVALGIGAPVAAITSSLIGVAIIAAVYTTGAFTGTALGLTIRLGVLGAVRWAPLIVVAVAVWLFVIRRRGLLTTS
jgi:hypothetical protein